jgi:2-polyprenyl-3-methyl-5-hydroxy-6-metoxy-1,4-benzoquinol methylase
MSYYNQHAQSYFDSTINVDMNPLYEKFIPLIEKGGLILDAGCGSGRDSKAFIELGFNVHAIDASESLSKLAEELICQPVEVTTFQAFKSTSKYDAIWACASLLHVPMNELTHVFENLSDHLKVNGIFYCSFKYGNEQVSRGGRTFSNLNDILLAEYLRHLPLKIKKSWRTGDLRIGREAEQWLNAILVKETL